MSIVHLDGSRLLLDLSPAELTLTRTVLEQLAEVVGDAGDPIAGRLTPDAYPEDSEASREFARYTSESLKDRRLDRIGAALAALDGGSPLELRAPEADAWLALLTDVRLVLADRLGLEDDEFTLPDGLMGDVYDWLTELQGMLVQGFDRLDAAAAGGGAA